MTATPHLVALDVDGTTINHAGDMSPAVHTAVRAAVDAGHHVTIATGRAILATLPILAKLGITTAREARWYLPFRYDDFSDLRPLGELIPFIAKQVAALTRAPGVAVGLIEGDEIVCAALEGCLADHPGLRVPVEASLGGEALRKRKAVLCRDTEGALTGGR